MSPDKAVSEVPEADVFDVVDVDHLADGAGVDDFLDLQAGREVSQDVADGHHHSGLCASFGDLLAVSLVYGHRLLQKQVVPCRIFQAQLK